MLPQFSLCKKLILLNSLCFPCLEKLTAKFPVFPVPWPPCKGFVALYVKKDETSTYSLWSQSAVFNLQLLTSFPLRFLYLHLPTFGAHIEHFIFT